MEETKNLNVVEDKRQTTPIVKEDDGHNCHLNAMKAQSTIEQHFICLNSSIP